MTERSFGLLENIHFCVQAVLTIATIVWIADIVGRWVDPLIMTGIYFSVLAIGGLVNGPIYKKLHAAEIARHMKTGLSREAAQSAFDAEWVE